MNSCPLKYMCPRKLRLLVQKCTIDTQNVDHTTQSVKDRNTHQSNNPQINILKFFYYSFQCQLDFLTVSQCILQNHIYRQHRYVKKITYHFSLKFCVTRLSKGKNLISPGTVIVRNMQLKCIIMLYSEFAFQQMHHIHLDQFL